VEEAVRLSPDDRALFIDALWKSLATREDRAREAKWAKEAEELIDAVGSW